MRKVGQKQTQKQKKKKKQKKQKKTKKKSETVLYPPARSYLEWREVYDEGTAEERHVAAVVATVKCEHVLAHHCAWE